MEKEYHIKYRVETEWHNPHNTTTHNDYDEVVKANSGKEAINKSLPHFSNPNKSVHLISIKEISLI
jgi:hypothetical protein